MRHTSQYITVPTGVIIFVILVILVVSNPANMTISGNIEGRVGKYHLAFPEEISEAKNGTILIARKYGDSILLEFPHIHEHTYESDDIFEDGEMLLPDEVHDDTLIVIHATFLNNCIRYGSPESDGDIKKFLDLTTVPYRKKEEAWLSD